MRFLRLRARLVVRKGVSWAGVLRLSDSARRGGVTMVMLMPKTLFCRLLGSQWIRKHGSLKRTGGFLPPALSLGMRGSVGRSLSCLGSVCGDYLTW